jgi:hypothetical protein
VYLVDINIFLEDMLPRKRSSECKRFPAMLRDGRASGVVSDFSIHSIMVLLDSLKRREKLRTFLASLTGYKGLRVHFTTIAEKLKAVELAEKEELDIDDAIQYAVALPVGAEAIVWFDRDFDSLKIPRVEQGDIVTSGV